MDIFSIFSLFYLIYIFRGAQILLRIGREWAQLKQEPLTRSKMYLAGQASFYIAVPPSVIVHELFHSLVIWYFGGRVVDFGFTFYGGYVVPDRLFPAPQQWLISIAGTVGSLLFGLLVWFATRNNGASTFRYFGLRTLRTMVYISLIFYPLLALLGFGDWATIYDFNATPILSGLTAVAHITTLFFFFRADRHGWFEMSSFETAAAQSHFTELAQQAQRNPHDKQLAARYIEALLQSGAEHQATTRLKYHLQQNPNDADGYALLARLEVGSNNHIPKQSKANAEKALNLGLSDASNKTAVYRILAEYALEHNQYPEAINQFSLAISTLGSTTNQEARQAQLQAYLAELYFRRSIAYKRQKSIEPAIQDIQQAIQTASAAGSNGRVQAYTRELEIIQQDSALQLDSSTNAPAPKDVV